jgi:hypothetical protein
LTFRRTLHPGIPLDSRRFRIPDHAASDQASLYLPGNEPVELGFDAPLLINTNGYVYIWVSNESKEARVWFDDLTITHKEHLVVQATDYGVWGDVIRELKSDIASYRYGYQDSSRRRMRRRGGIILS